MATTFTSNTATNTGTSTSRRDPEARALFESERQAGRDNLQGVRNKITDLYNQVGETYTNLVNAGKQEEAASLRDAAERFARAGSQTGVSSDQRIASLQKLAGSLRVAGQVSESRIAAQGIAQTLQVLQSLANIDHRALADSLNAFNTADVTNTSRNTSRQSGINTNGVQNISSRSNTASRTPSVSVRPDNSAQLAATRSLGTDFRNASNIAKTIQERGLSASRNNPFFQPASPSSALAQGNLAVTQRNMGVMPGLFQSSGQIGRDPATAIAPRQPTNVVAPSVRSNNPSAGVAPSYGTGSVIAPRASTPSPFTSTSSGQFDFNSPTSSATGKYRINPITGKRTLIASGNR
jgi:hypothetical protein